MDDQRSQFLLWIYTSCEMGAIKWLTKDESFILSCLANSPKISSCQRIVYLVIRHAVFRLGCRGQHYIFIGKVQLMKGHGEKLRRTCLCKDFEDQECLGENSIDFHGDVISGTWSYPRVGQNTGCFWDSCINMTAELENKETQQNVEIFEMVFFFFQLLLNGLYIPLVVVVDWI